MSQDTSSTDTPYVGYQQSMFEKGASFLLKQAELWVQATDSELSEETVKAIEAIQSGLAESRVDIAKQIATLNPDAPDYLDCVTALTTANAVKESETKTQVEALRSSASRKGFESFLTAYGLKVAGTRSSGAGGLDVAKVYRVKVGQVIRYYLPYDDKVVCYSANGKSSDKLFEITPESFPNLYPTSATALQRLHYIAYRESSKTFKDVVERLKVAEANYATWDVALGQSSKATNGLNDTTTMDKSPEDWLKENPIKEK